MAISSGDAGTSQSNRCLTTHLGVAIDENDLCVLKRMFGVTSDWSEWWRKAVVIRNDDSQRRVRELDMWEMPSENHRKLSLPPSIEQLDCLEELKFPCYEGTRIPEEIGNLKNLRDLHLTHHGVQSLPSSIGQLTNLRHLYLQGTRIRALPSSIGQLKNLESLVLQWTRELVELPMEIGELSCLMQLLLHSSSIKHLPPSIGKLRNLQELELSNSKIQSLPSSIGQLKYLEILDLQSTTDLLELPVEIGELCHLRCLWLQSSGVKSLPSSIGKLRNLVNLEVPTFAVTTISTIHELIFSRGCMQAMSRAGFGIQKVDNKRITPNLWPLLLRRAPLAFEPIKLKFRSGQMDFLEVLNYPKGSLVSRADAIRQLLLGSRGSFVTLVVNLLSDDEYSKH